MNVEPILTDFIVNEILYAREKPTVDLDEPLLDGLIDSTDVLLLVVFLEERFGVRVEDDELVPENFTTIRELARYVREKAGAR